MAAPLVSGLLGLMISSKPNASREEIIECLEENNSDDNSILVKIVIASDDSLNGRYNEELKTIKALDTIILS